MLVVEGERGVAGRHVQAAPAVAQGRTVGGQGCAARGHSHGPRVVRCVCHVVPSQVVLEGSGRSNQDSWKRENTYLWHEDRIVVPSDRIRALLKCSHESSSHFGADRTLKLFKRSLHSTWSDDQLRKTLQLIVDKCRCQSCKPADIKNRGLYSTLPIPHCANSALYVDYTEMPKFGGYDTALVVTCGLTKFTWVFPCTKPITGEETIKILLEQWF